MEISILIVNYNTKIYLKECIESIYDSKTDYQYEIVIVDNNSSDCSADFIHKAYPQIKLLSENYNHGFSRAMNKAYRISKGEYLLLLNPDTRLYEDSLNNIVNCLNENPQIGLLGGISIDIQGNRLYPSTIFHKIEPLKSFPSLCLNKKRTDYILGTGITVRKSLLPKDSIFNEDAFLFWEEWDLAKCIKEANGLIRIDDSIKIFHHTSVTFKRNPKKLSLLVKLQIAFSFKNRLLTYGRYHAYCNSVIQITDNALLLGSVMIGRLFSANPTQNKLKKIMITRYLSGIKGNLYCLLFGIKYSKWMNQKAFTYFNKS